MKIVVTIKSFDDEMSQFDDFIPSLSESMKSLIDQILEMDNPPINIEGLNSIHFTNDYLNELFAFQKSVGHNTFATRNKIAGGHAQVVCVEEGEGKPDDIGYHIFIDKKIPLTILIGQLTENNTEITDESSITIARNSKNEFIRMIKHELAHVEDKNNQKRWEWLDAMYSVKDLQNGLRQNALRFWEEYYACKRSNFIYDADIVVQDIKSLLNNLETAEKEICDLRWKYNKMEISLDDFVAKFHDYIKTALIYCCYFMGHMNLMYEQMKGVIEANMFPSRFYCFVPEIWSELRRIDEAYPEWKGPEILDGISVILIKCINSFEIYLTEEENGIRYDIPVCKLKTRHEESQVEE